MDLHFWWQGLIPHVLLSLPRKDEPCLHSHRWISNWKKKWGWGDGSFSSGVANFNNMICPFILNATTGEVWIMPTFRNWDMLHVDHISCVIHLKSNQMIRHDINRGYMQIFWIKSCLTYLLDQKYRSFRLGTSSVVKKTLRSKYRMTGSIARRPYESNKKKLHAMIPNDSHNGYLIRHLSQYDQPNIDRYGKVLLNYTNVINYGRTLPYNRERQCSMS